jgi:hypothetical protein
LKKEEEGKKGDKIMQEERSCEERIDEMLQQIIKDMRKVLDAEDPIEAINEEALALTKSEVYRLELSWGGPQDYIDFKYDPENHEVLEITYHFLDWFDGASRKLSVNSDEFKVLETLFYNCILIE